MAEACQKVRQAILEAGKGADSRDWAASTSDDKLMCALPNILNKKHFRKLTHEETVEKLE